MRSGKPKVLCEVLFKPMLQWVLDAVRDAGVEDRCVVTGHLAEQVEDFLALSENAVAVVRQTERLGTGHAVQQARDFLLAHKGGSVLIACGDAPLLDTRSIVDSLNAHKNSGSAVTVLSAVVEDPTGYGRMVRDESGRLLAIVEQKDADEETRAIREINSGAYWFEVDALLDVLGGLSQNNASGEYYLTDAVRLLSERGETVEAFVCADAAVALGANDRVQLHALNEYARDSILRRLMLAGVDIPCTDGVLIGPDVTVGCDTQILPGTILRGKTAIGSGCVIGPNSLIENSVVADGARLNSVQCCLSEVGAGVTAGPFVHIRPNSRIQSRVKIGDFVEVKNSAVGEGTKVPHLTYVGDSDVGSGVNFGCGCVTVNYDGEHKNRCVVGDHAFIGCNTNLIAPVTIGDYGYTAAGSTITDNVPDSALAIARARQVNKDEWVSKRFPEKKK